MLDSVASSCAAGSDLVVTIHGLLAARRSFAAMRTALTLDGFATFDFCYPSLRGSIDTHAANLSEQIVEFARSPAINRIHFVTHSMGGVIGRAAILRAKLEARFTEKCGSVVMLAPPNGGSRLTRIPLGPFASLFPQLAQMSESPDSFVRSLPRFHHMRLGVIAAKHDWVVAPEATHLEGQCDHALIPTTHQRLAQDPRAIEMAVRFLRRGCLQDDRAISITMNRHVLRTPQRRRVHSSAA